MGLTYRRSIKLFGPLRLNISGSGIGFSFGVKGAHVSTGPRGTALNLSKSGLRYTKKLSNKRFWEFWK